MPRTIPWLKGLGNTKRESSSPITEIKQSSSPRVKNEIPTEKGFFGSKNAFLKSSPSPPSSPIHRCPSEEYLQDGLDKDDIYMMVEDEFYTIAQTFTRHLHYAEFIRRKKEAKLQNAATIADIARPTDGVTPMSDELKKKYAAEELRANQKEKLNAIYGKPGQSGDDDMGDDLEKEKSWAGTHLQDFMFSLRRGRALVGKQGIRSTTRAAAGFSQSSGVRGGGDEEGGGGEVEEEPRAVALQDETTDDDDDDLDVWVRQAVPTVLQGNRETSSSSTMMRPSVGPSRSSFAKTPLEDTRELQAKTITVGSSPNSMCPSTGKSCFGVIRKLQSTAPTMRPSPSSVRPTSTNQPPEDTRQKVTESRNAPSNTVQAKRRLIFDDFDELPEPRKPGIQPQRRRSDLTNKQQKKPKEKNTGSKKSRLDEVPMFLS
ncbi:hypothetical protein BDV12DRAFT_123612 [Aspergillus spectabilis]